MRLLDLNNRRINALLKLNACMDGSEKYNYVALVALERGVNYERKDI